MNESEEQLGKRLYPLVKKMEYGFHEVNNKIIIEDLGDDNAEDWVALYCAATLGMFEHYLRFPLATNKLKKDMAIDMLSMMQDKLYEFIDKHKKEE